MTRACSMDLRERVVAAVGDCQSYRQVSALLRVSASSVVKWPQLARLTGSSAPKPVGGRPWALALLVLEKLVHPGRHSRRWPRIGQLRQCLNPHEFAA